MTTTTTDVQSTPAGTREPGAKKGIFRFRPIYLLVAAWIVGVLGPYSWMFLTSITPRTEMNTGGLKILPENPSFAAYGELLSQTPFIQNFVNSVIVALGVVAVTTMCALAAGTALSRYRFRGRQAVLYAILLVQLFPMILLIVPLYVQLGKLGLLDKKIGLIIIYSAFAMSFTTWLMKGFVDQIPIEIEEASYIDGCSKFQSFFYVILPLSRPGLAAGGTYAFIYAWNEYLFASTFTSTDQAQTITVGLKQFIGESLIRWDYLTSGGVLAAMPILIAFMLVQKNLIAGLTSGAVKG